MVRYHEKDLAACKAHAEMIQGYVVTVRPEQLNSEKLAKRERGRFGDFSVDEGVFIGANLHGILPLPEKQPVPKLYTTTMSWTEPTLSIKTKQARYLATLEARRKQRETL